MITEKNKEENENSDIYTPILNIKNIKEKYFLEKIKRGDYIKFSNGLVGIFYDYDNIPILNYPDSYDWLDAYDVYISDFYYSTYNILNFFEKMIFNFKLKYNYYFK